MVNNWSNKASSEKFKHSLDKKFSKYLIIHQELIKIKGLFPVIVSRQ